MVKNKKSPKGSSSPKGLPETSGHRLTAGNAAALGVGVGAFGVGAYGAKRFLESQSDAAAAAQAAAVRRLPLVAAAPGAAAAAEGEGGLAAEVQESLDHPANWGLLLGALALLAFVSVRRRRAAAAPPTERSSSELLKVEGTTYGGEDTDGDFKYDITQPGASRTLFVFNDNARKEGKGGTAAVRGNKNAVGIATGWNPAVMMKNGDTISGFRSLTDTLQDATSRMAPGFNGRPTITAKEVIDGNIEEIKKKLRDGKYNRLVFSADNTGQIGTAIFKKVGQDVKDYITTKLMTLPQGAP